MIAQAHGLAAPIRSRRPAGQMRTPLHALPFIWLDRHRGRRELARLLRVGPHMIADIGLDLAAVEAEIDKPLWRD